MIKQLWFFVCLLIFMYSIYQTHTRVALVLFRAMQSRYTCLGGSLISRRTDKRHWLVCRIQNISKPRVIQDREVCKEQCDKQSLYETLWTTSPVNLMFDLELIATENRLIPFETLWLLYTPCKFRQKSRQGKYRKRAEKSCQILAMELFTAGLPYPWLFYVYALTVISGFTRVYLSCDF